LNVIILGLLMSGMFTKTTFDKILNLTPVLLSEGGKTFIYTDVTM